MILKKGIHFHAVGHQHAKSHDAFMVKKKKSSVLLCNSRLGVGHMAKMFHQSHFISQQQYSKYLDTIIVL